MGNLAEINLAEIHLPLQAMASAPLKRARSSDCSPAALQQGYFQNLDDVLMTSDTLGQQAGRVPELLGEAGDANTAAPIQIVHKFHNRSLDCHRELHQQGYFQHLDDVLLTSGTLGQHVYHVPELLG